MLWLEMLRVNWLVTEHLRAQGRPNARGRLLGFWYPKKT
jgi:hypothetical protein